MKQEKITKFIQTKDADRKWHVIDANDVVLGRLAARAASVIRGKHKPIFTPNTDTGDFVIVVNAEKVKLTAVILVLENRHEKALGQHDHRRGSREGLGHFNQFITV